MIKRLAKILGVSLLLSILGVCVGLYFFAESLLPQVSAYLDISQDPQECDYALILNGDPETRVYACACLYKAGFVKKIILTQQDLLFENKSVQEGLTLSEKEVTLKILLKEKVNKKDILVLKGEISSTADEAGVLSKFMQDKQDKTIMIITNKFHTRRAYWVFKKLLGEKNKIIMIGTPRENVDPRQWWRSSDGCGVYLSEYLKMLYYRLKY